MEKPSIEQVAWVLKHLHDHFKEGGSYRSLIYDRLGFGPEAYQILYKDGFALSDIAYEYHQLSSQKEVNMTVELIFKITKTLGSSINFKILTLIMDSPEKKLCSADLCTKLGLTQPALFVHLKQLKELGLLQGKRISRTIYYFVNYDLLRQYVEGLAQFFLGSGVIFTESIHDTAE